MSDLARDSTDGAGDGWIVDPEVGTVDGGGKRALGNVVQGLGDVSYKPDLEPYMAEGPCEWWGGCVDRGWE
jgi:hypothetical protein